MLVRLESLARVEPNNLSHQRLWERQPFSGGGREGDRTLDLGVANAALSQLSYSPVN